MERHPVAKQLLEAFIHVHRISWQDGRGTQGYKRSEIMVLYCLNKASADNDSGMRVSEISKRLNVTSPTITQLIKGMEANGLVERRIDDKDRRAVRIHLTGKGSKVHDQALKAFLGSLNGLVEFLGEEESVRLAENLKKAAAYLKERHDAYINQFISGGEGEA